MSGSRTHAAVVDYLAGVPWTSSDTTNFGSSNSNRPLTFTDGSTNPTNSSNAGTYEYIGYAAGATVIYDLGSPALTGRFALWAGLQQNRGGPKNVTITRTNDPTFTSGLTIDNVVLAPYVDGSAGTPAAPGAYYQSAFITDVAAQYVRFAFPAGVANYYTQTDANFATLSELQLLPEPASLGLLALGGVVLMRRRQVSGR
jgi:hypothetical protein